MNLVCKVSRVVKARRVLVAGALLCLLPAGTSFAQVLDQVPSDALVVLKFNHLQDTSGKMGTLMQALGITDFAPQMQDPLGAFQKQTGMENGLDKTGELAIVLLNGPFPDETKPNADGKPTPPPVLALIPVSDYKAFLGNATVVKTEGDITTVHFKNNETEDNFIANWGTYAVISPNKDALSKKPGGLKLAGAASGDISKRDALIYVNWPSVKAVLLPKLQENRTKILDEMEKNMNAASPGGENKNTPLMRAVVNEVLDISEAFMRDSVATTVGIDFDKAGLMATALSEFTPDSYMGKLTSQLKGTDKPLLTGLPDTKYMFYGGSALDPAVGSKVINDLIEPLRKDIGDMGESGKQILAMIDSSKESWGSIEGGSFGWVAPNPNQMGQVGVFQLVANYHGDANKIHDTMIENYSKMDSFMNDNMGGKGTAKNTVTKGAKTIDGVKIDQVQTQISFTGNSPQEMQMNQMIGIMYGPNGLITNVGVTDPKTMLVVIGGDDTLLNSAVAASKSGSNPAGTADVLKDVDSHLPKTRVAAMYLPLDVIVSTGVGYATKFGMPVPVQIPPNLPPIGMTFSAEGNAIRGDEFIPTPLVQSLIAAGMQMYLQMHGGQQNGGGGL